MKDYAADAVPRLTGQFYQSEKLTSLIAEMVNPLSVMEDSADALTTEKWIDTAVGRQLDGCGYIVGVYRRGMDDSEYRAEIKFKVFVNISNGTPRDLVRGLAFLTSPTDAQYLESWPATAILFSNGIFIPPGLQPAMQNLSPAAISDIPVCVSYAELPFRFYRDIRLNPYGELFVNDATSFLNVNNADMLVTYTSAPSIVGRYSALGGVVPSELYVNGMELDVGNRALGVYNPNTVVLLGTDHLTGVFQL
jgi:hypothetical protein